MRIITAMLLLLHFGTVAGQQSDSLIAMARERGGSAGITLHLNTPISTVEQLVEKSTIIVQGSIRSVSTKLSPDETVVRTAYEVVPIRYYKGTASTSRRPGATKPVIVSRPGGALEVNGLRLTTTVDIFPEDESLSVGTVAILFLTPYEDNPDEFRIAGGPFGVFKLSNGTVSAMTGAVARRRGDDIPTLDAFEHRILARLRK
jgi:hypothetical protein